jgi:hypothetical protein
MEATQVYVAGAVTAPNIQQRWLSSMLMGREQSICLFQSVADVGRIVSVVHWISNFGLSHLIDDGKAAPFSWRS